MNFHIVPDDKFIDTFIEIAEEVCPPDSNIFLVRSDAPFKLVKSPSAIAAPLNSEPFNDIIGKATNQDRVYMHYLTHDVCDWVNTTTCPAQLVWIFWGAEFYENAGVDFDLFEPLTEDYVELHKERMSKYYLLRLYRQWKFERKMREYRKYLRDKVGSAISKLTYFMHYNVYDYELIKSRFPTNAGFIKFFYPPPYTYSETDAIIAKPGTGFKVDTGAVNIWLGNSGYVANNHLDLMHAISKSGNNEVIWAPCTYRDDAYVAYLETKGREWMGDRFKVLKDYMTFDGFVEAVHAMDVGIMPQKRPQAFGNIQLLLYFGKTVYMYENTLFRFLKEMGFVVFNIDEVTNGDFTRKLNAVERQINKSLMEQHFDKEIAKTYIYNCLTLAD